MCVNGSTSAVKPRYAPAPPEVFHKRPIPRCDIRHRPASARRIARRFAPQRRRWAAYLRSESAHRTESTVIAAIQAAMTGG